MAELITLEQFQASKRNYHIYRIRETKIAHLDHYHNYYQVCYVVSGEILHRQNDDTVTLCAGDAFIVPPGLSHSLHFHNAYAEIYSLAFEESLFAPGFPQSNAYQFLESLQSKAADPAHSSVRLCITMDRDQRRLIENLLECLIQQQPQRRHGIALTTIGRIDHDAHIPPILFRGVMEVYITDPHAVGAAFNVGIEPVRRLSYPVCIPFG